MVPCTNDALDVGALAAEIDHAGLSHSREQRRPDVDAVGPAEVVDQYGTDELADEVVELGEWSEWLHERSPSESPDRIRYGLWLGVTLARTLREPFHRGYDRPGFAVGGLPWRSALL